MNIIKRICALSAALICLCPTFAQAESSKPEPYDILGNFRVDLLLDEETQSPALIAGNEKYLNMLSDLVVESNAVCDDGILHIEADKYIATDDSTIITWQTTNVTDSLLYVQTSEFDAQFAGVEYDLCGGLTWKNYLIRPGETINSRFMGTLCEHVQPGDGAFTLDMQIYEIDMSAVPTDYFTDDTGAYSGGFYPDESALTLRGSTVLNVPLTMGASDVRSALTAGKPIEKQFNGYVLRINKADMSAMSFEIEYERIYETEQQARGDSPIGASFWEYEFNDLADVYWLQTGYGTIPDDPVQLDDGRWAWQIEYKVYYMFMQPDAIIMHPRQFVDGTGYVEAYGTSEDVTLKLSETAEIVAKESADESGLIWAYGFADL